MRRFHPLITGTLLLTAVGFFCRILGFFYRIFLSRTIGAEGLGLYQMIFPIHGIAFALCAGPIQTSLSRLTAASPEKGRAFLRVSLALSLSIALPLTSLIYTFADFLAARVLLAPECAPLLPALALSIPFCAIHACCCGYYYGLKKTAVPAFSQVVEQCIRIFSVLLIVHVCRTNRIPITVLLAVWGLLIGEAASAVFCLLVYGCSKPAATLQNTDTHISSYSRQTRKNTTHFQYSSRSTPPYTPDTSSTTPPSQKKFAHTPPLLLPLLTMALPLMANRLTLSFLQSLEAIFVPNQLLLSGLSRVESVSIYGVLTGMALPFVLFPSAITNSLAVVLLPAVSEAQAQNQPDKIEHTISMALRYSLYMGILCVRALHPLRSSTGRNLLPQRRCRTFHPDFILALPVSLPLHHHGKYFKRAWENRNRLHPPYGFHASHPVARPFRHPAMGDFRLSGGASHQRTGTRLSPHPRPRPRNPDPPASQPGHCKTGILPAGFDWDVRSYSKRVLPASPVSACPHPVRYPLPAVYRRTASLTYRYSQTINYMLFCYIP